MDRKEKAGKQSLSNTRNSVKTPEHWKAYIFLWLLPVTRVPRCLLYHSPFHFFWYDQRGGSDHWDHERSSCTALGAWWAHRWSPPPSAAAGLAASETGTSTKRNRAFIQTKSPVLSYGKYWNLCCTMFNSHVFWLDFNKLKLKWMENETWTCL